jgi:hypothetical protein
MPYENFLSKTYLTSEHTYTEWRQTRIHLRISQVCRVIFLEGASIFQDDMHLIRSSTKIGQLIPLLILWAERHTQKTGIRLL